MCELIGLLAFKYKLLSFNWITFFVKLKAIIADITRILIDDIRKKGWQIIWKRAGGIWRRLKKYKLCNKNWTKADYVHKNCWNDSNIWKGCSCWKENDNIVATIFWHHWLTVAIHVIPEDFIPNIDLSPLHLWLWLKSLLIMLGSHSRE